ncbi:MAG: SRPBCC family protein [Chloroflexota bacterium]|nr:SRPBCC family protein [Chloroflexota bacterium]
MAHITETINIAAPVAQVWDFITHTANLPQWAADAIEEATGDAMEVGTAWTEKLHVAGRALDVTWRIHEADAPHKLTFVGATPGGGTARGSHLLAEAPGGTEMTTELEYTLPGGVFGEIADRLILERRTARDVQDMLGKAKAAIEGPDAGADLA